jgi:hypothetical protein
MPALDWLELEKNHLYLHVLEGTTEVVLEYAGEIRYGPTYHALWMRIDGRPEDGRYFGPGRNVHFREAMNVSTDGRYVVLDKCLQINRPDSSVIIIDAHEGREAELLHVESALVTAIAFEPDGVKLTFDRCEARTVPFPATWTKTSWWL